ncbi:MAG: hypothetical protein LUD14_07640 [Clostridiales bacterium]|nr:hypothetical protein [Clostridiales bacterium]
MRHIVYDGESFYELDEECLKKKEEEERRKETAWQRKPESGTDYSVKRRRKRK